MNPLQNSSVGKLTVILAIVTLALSGCATVGPSSVQLAAETSARSAELGTLHQELVHKYFALERERIETFLTKEWEPTFLRHLLGTSGILQDLQESQTFDDADRAELSLALKDYLTDPTEADKLARAITTSLTTTRAPEPAAVRTILAQYVDDDRVDAATAHVAALLGTAEPARRIIDFAADAHEEMQAQRDALLKPLQEAEATVLADLASSYTQLAQAHGTITARLEAASHAAREQDELLKAIGVNDPGKIRAQLAGISKSVGDALAAAGTSDDPATMTNALLNALKPKPTPVTTNPD